MVLLCNLETGSIVLFDVLSRAPCDFFPLSSFLHLWIESPLRQGIVHGSLLCQSEVSLFRFSALNIPCSLNQSLPHGAFSVVIRDLGHAWGILSKVLWIWGLFRMSHVNGRAVSAIKTTHKLRISPCSMSVLVMEVSNSIGNWRFNGATTLTAKRSSRGSSLHLLRVRRK